MIFYKPVKRAGCLWGSTGSYRQWPGEMRSGGGAKARLMEWVDVIRGPRGDATLEFFGRERATLGGKSVFL